MMRKECHLLARFLLSQKKQKGEILREFVRNKNDCITNNIEIGHQNITKKKFLRCPYPTRFTFFSCKYDGEKYNHLYSFLIYIRETHNSLFFPLLAQEANSKVLFRLKIW